MKDEYPMLPRNRGEDDPKMIGLWKIGRTIGNGSSGRVRIARHSRTGQYAAVKIVSKTILVNSIRKNADSAEHILLSIEREIVIMKLTDHPNIMRLYDVWETSSELYLILEYVEGGELFDYLCSKGRLSTSEALAYFQQIISAVNYCHGLNIAHRDLKPENLLMDQNKNIKVADFGMAAWQAGSKNGLLQTACGSPHYAAPEVIMGKEYNGHAADIWSCGVILYALLVGRLPFDDEDLPSLLDKVKSGIFDIPSGMDPLAMDLITKMLQKDVVKRITIPDILIHPFFLSQEPESVDACMPKLDDFAKPLSAREGIDQDIFSNLCTLWHDTSKEDIEASLKSPEPNWQKGVYRLLVEYQNRYLRNHHVEEEPTQRKKRKKASTANGHQRTTMTSSQPSYLVPAPSFLSPRTASPTSRRAAGCVLQRDDSDYVQLSAPSLGLHSPNPGIDLSSSLSPSYLPSLTSPWSPTLCPTNLPAIQASELMDHDEIQHFFQQIGEHLDAMQESTAGVLDLGASSTPSMSNSMEFHRPRKERPAQTRSHSSHQADMYARPGKPGKFREVNKENLHLATIGPVVTKKSSLRSSGDKHPALRVQIIEPSPNKSCKKISSGTPTTLSAFSDSSFMPFPTLRRRWLSNMFGFKPVIYHLLSTQDGLPTREECHRMLVNLGVRVVLTYAESAGVLECRSGATTSLSGLLLMSVRFRVEVQKPTSTQIAAGYRVALHLTQERGSLSSFQSIYNSLRKDWKLDVLLCGNWTGS